MRPPQNAGEDTDERDAAKQEVVASMRPPQNAGEDAALAALATQSVAVAWRE